MKYGLFSENVAAFVALLGSYYSCLGSADETCFSNTFLISHKWHPLFHCVLGSPSSLSLISNYWGPIGSRLYCWRGTFSIGIRCPCQDPKLGCTTLIHIVGRKSSTIWLSFLFRAVKMAPKCRGRNMIAPGRVRHQTLRHTGVSSKRGG